MFLRSAALPAACILSLALASSAPSAFAQTKPKNTVPTDRAEARQIVAQLVREGRIMRSSQIKRGMIGVGRSVFQGTKIEEFKVVVLGNLERVQGGADIILIKVLDGPVVKRQSGIIAGMSGSPVYINGKMIGAIALGWGFPKEPIGGVTPIESMIQSALPDRSAPRKMPPPAIASTYRPRQPLQVLGRSINRIEVSRDPRRVAFRDGAGGATMTLKPVTTLLQLGGFSESSMPRLRKIFEPYGVQPIMGIPSKKTGVKANLAPGAAIGVQLVSGDMDQSAVGTVTFRWGQRVLAFGHPMFGQGAVSLPISTSYIHEIFPSYQRSFKLASPISAVGALQQDTQFAIGGTVGMKADTIPMTVSVREPGRQIAKTYRVRIMKDPLLTPQLIGMVAAEAIETTLGLTSDKMVRVGLSMKIDGAKPIKRRNLIYANQGVTSAALFDLGQTLGLSQANEFARGSINRVDLSVLVEEKRATARIKSMTADRNKVKAGESVGVRVALEPIERPGTIYTKTFRFEVPEDAPSGALRIGASAAANFWPLQMRVGGPPPEPNNLPQLVDAWAKVGPMNELLVVASTPRQFLQVEQKKIPNAPPTFAKLLQTATISNLGSYNETEERRETTQFMLDGAQFLSIPVESKLHPDTPEASTAVTQTQTTTTTTAPATTTPPSTETPVPQPAPAPDSQGAFGMFSQQLIEAITGNKNEEAMFARVFDAGLFNAHRKYLSTQAGTQRAQRMQTTNDPKAPLTPPQATVPGKNTGPNLTATAEPTATVAPTVAPTPDSKLLARPAQSWVQTPADFIPGQFERTQVSSAGRLQISPATRQILKTADPFVWAVAGDAAGNVYLAMSNPARVAKVSPMGAVSTLWKNTDVAVTALALRGDSLYAGTTPSGVVQRINTGTGQAQQVLASAGTFVGALEFDEQNRLLIGGGGEISKLWRVDRDAGTAPQVLATVPQDAIRAISARGEEIFFGTGNEAVLYRLSADRIVSALYQAGERGAKNAADLEILGVAAAPEGVYFGASNAGTLMRWTSDGVESLYAAPQQAVYALERAKDGRLYMGTGDKGVVYEVRPGRGPTDTRAARLLEPQPTQALALDLLPNGDLLVGTGNAGSAYRIALGDTASGTFISTVFDAKTVVRWGAIRLAGRNAAIETRAGNTIDPDTTWSAWQAATAEGDERHVASPPARYLQYRVTLSGGTAAPWEKDFSAALQEVSAVSKNGNLSAAWEDKVPQLTRVEVLYRTKNSAPAVGFSSVRGGEFLSGKPKLTWAGRDADSDVLRYKVSISSDDGLTWKPIALENATDESVDFDTAKYKDGSYRAKVEVSDAARNPDDPQRDQEISQTFTIDNTAPSLVNARIEITPDGPRLRANASDALSPIVGAVWQPAKDEKKPAASVASTSTATPAISAITPAKAATPASTSTSTSTSTSGAITATTTTTLTSATSAEGEKKTEDWNALAAEDGLFDSRREAVVALIDEDTPEPTPDTKPDTKPTPTKAKGERKIEVRVQDAAGNSATVPVTVPAPVTAP